MHHFIEHIRARLAAAKIHARPVALSCRSDETGKISVTFRSECLFLKFTHEDGEDYLEIATALAPKRFFWFGDIEVAMGWSSFERMNLRKEAPPVDEVINRLAQHIDVLRKSFFKNVDYFTQVSITRTMRPGTWHRPHH